jgi:predicted Zn-dependent protease
MKRSIACALTLATVGITAACLPVEAASRARPKPAAAAPAGGVYQQFRLPSGQSARWIAEQMPVRVWVSHGLSLDGITDPNTGAPVTNTANTAGWPDAVIRVMQNPDEVAQLPIAEGFSDAEWQAAVQGINSWKWLEKEGLCTYEFVDNPDDADIYVFWTNHFVNKLGLALFENDIRGYTAKYLLPTATVMAAIQRNDLELVRRSRKPVVILLRTAESNGQPIALGKMKASAAHEFGHALGINGHSANPGDLMSIYYGRGVVSANDAATMRFLYKHQPDLMP